MVKKIKKIVFPLFLTIIFLFLFAPREYPDNFQFQEILNSFSKKQTIKQKDTNNQNSKRQVLVIFNSGGWGNTPLEKAQDFAPIIEEIQKTLKNLGYNSVVAPYKRTKDSFLGKIEGTRGILTSFQNQSQKLAQEIEHFVKNNPGTKVIIAGLSNGGAFVNNIMERMPEDKRDDVLAIEAGVPFWENVSKSENILLLDNGEKDPLAKKQTKVLFSTLLKAPFKWLSAKFSGNSISFSQALHVPGHDYFWESPSTGPQIITFLEEKIY